MLYIHVFLLIVSPGLTVVVGPGQMTTTTVMKTTEVPPRFHHYAAVVHQTARVVHVLVGAILVA